MKTLLFKQFLYIAVFFASFSLLNCEAKSYTEVPALIHLDKNEQSDTNGFNLVEHLPAFIYNQIQKGTVKLWDSPKKLIVISFNALNDIENSNHVSFSNTKILFINELWTSNRRKTEFVIAGLSFLSESPNGKISFGFVDMVDVLKLLGTNYIPCNVNGPAQLTYLEALYSRKYHFNLIQFGNNNFSVKPEKSIEIKNDAFYSKKKVIGLYKIPDTKMVVYSIEKSPGTLNDPGLACFNTIQNFLNENKEILFNIGGDKYFDFHNKLLNVTVTRIEITEIWTKKNNTVQFEPTQITIYVNNKPLNSLSMSEILNWQLLINFKTLNDIFIEKSFQYTIYKINKDLIHVSESGKYQKALMNKNRKWSQVSEDVKFSRD